MKSFNQFLLTESISIREIESFLNKGILTAIDRQPMSTLREFEFNIIRPVFKDACEKFIPELKCAIKEIEFGRYTTNGWFGYHGKSNLVQFGFAFNEQEIQKFIYETKLDKKVINRIIQTLSHELLHAVQYVRSDLKSKVEPRREFTTKNYSEQHSYYSTKEEIEAYAMNTVQELDNTSIDPDKILSVLKKSSSYPQKKLFDAMKSLSPSFKIYFELFGANHTDRKARNVWRHFLRKFIFHLEDKFGS